MSVGSKECNFKKKANFRIFTSENKRINKQT